MPPDHIAHKNQAIHNKKCAYFLLENGWPDWAIVAAFYSALHYTKYGFICFGKPFKENSTQTETIHIQQMNHVQKCFGDKVYQSYKLLYTMSDTVRYIRNYTGTGKVPSLDNLDQNKAQRVISTHLNLIFKEIETKTTPEQNNP